ncbi:MAG: radical SAM protein [Clostridiaceae bacterium]|nr:radical SAM protein [Eubacteriales bacterium]
MNAMQEDERMPIYDKVIGILFRPKKGTIKTAAPEHAQVLEKAEGNLCPLPRAGAENIKRLWRLEIMIATDCNLNCGYCCAYGGNFGGGAQVMQPAAAVTYLRELIAGKYDDVGTVMFFGGEPTTQPDTVKAICGFFEACISEGILKSMPAFTMVTNGTLLDSGLIETICRYDIKVAVSVDGSPQANDMLRIDRAGNGTFDKIAEGIDNLRAAGNPPRMLVATYTSLHERAGVSKSDVMEFLKSRFGISKIMVADCSPAKEEDALACILRNPAPCRDRFAFDTDVIREAGLGRRVASIFYDDIVCGAGLTSAALLPDGKLYPCRVFAGREQFCMAHYNGQAFDFTDYPKVMQRLRMSSKSTNSVCRGRRPKTLCGICPAVLQLSMDAQHDEISCSHEKMNFTLRLLAPAKEKAGPKDWNERRGRSAYIL